MFEFKDINGSDDQSDIIKLSGFQDRIQNDYELKKKNVVILPFYKSMNEDITQQVRSNKNLNVQDQSLIKSRQNSLEHAKKKQRSFHFFKQHSPSPEQVKDEACQSIQKLKNSMNQFAKKIQNRDVLDDKVNQSRIDSLQLARMNKLQRHFEDKYGMKSESIFNGAIPIKHKRYKSNKEFSEYLKDVIYRPNMFNDFYTNYENENKNPCTDFINNYNNLNSQLNS